MIADIEELEEMDASEIRGRRLHAKEVLTPMKGDSFMLPGSDGTVKTPGGDRRLRPSTFIRIVLNEERNKVNQTDFLLQTLFKMTLHWMMRKPTMTFGLLQEISFIAIT